MPVVDSGLTFGDFLRQLRRRMALTQSELAAQVGFSVSHISLLEKNARLPDVQQVRQRFGPALGLQNEPRLLQRLLQLAAHARGEAPPLPSEKGGNGEPSPGSAPGQERRFLPAPLTVLVGRQEEIDRAAQRLMDAPGRLLTLTGPPGVGKSRLAWAVAERLEALFAHGVCAVELASLRHAGFLADALLGAMGLHETSSAPPEQRLIEWLRRRELLLVLDNFDLLLTTAADAEEGERAAGLLVTLLQASPGLRLLVTSRAPLRLRFEQRYKVQPLPVQAAVELFLQRMEAVEPEALAVAPSLAAIAQICLRLDCLPLAVELMAARSDIFSPEAMLARLQESSLELLSQGPRDLPAHQRTLRGAIERSYGLLTPGEQHLFRGLGIFVGGFDLHAVEAIFPEDTAINGVQSLIARSLVRSVHSGQGTRRYQLLETLRAYALEQLQVNGEEEERARQHADYYGHRAKHAAATALDTGTSRSLAQLTPDHDNIRSALGWLLARQPIQAQKLVGDMRRYWYTFSLLEEGAAWAQQALAASPRPTQERASALLTLAQMIQNLGQAHQARGHLAAAAGIFEQAGSLLAWAEALIELGWVVYQTERPTASLDYFRRALVLAEQRGALSIQAHALTSLTHVMLLEGISSAELRAFIEESIRICEELGDEQSRSHALLNLGTYYTQTGEYAAAIQTLRQAQSSADATPNLSELGWICASLAELLLISGPLTEVAALLDRALHLFQLSNKGNGVMMVRHHQGELARREGRWAEAQIAFAESHQLARNAGNMRVVARCLMGLGRVALATGRSETGIAQVQEARTLLSQEPAFLPPEIGREYALVWQEAALQARQSGCQDNDETA